MIFCLFTLIRPPYTFAGIEVRLYSGANPDPIDVQFTDDDGVVFFHTVPSNFSLKVVSPLDGFLYTPTKITTSDTSSSDNPDPDTRTAINAHTYAIVPVDPWQCCYTGCPINHSQRLHLKVEGVPVTTCNGLDLGHAMLTVEADLDFVATNAAWWGRVAGVTQVFDIDYAACPNPSFATQDPNSVNKCWLRYDCWGVSLLCNKSGTAAISGAGPLCPSPDPNLDCRTPLLQFLAGVSSVGFTFAIPAGTDVQRMCDPYYVRYSRLKPKNPLFPTADTYLQTITITEAV